jgi:hypothetical protein
MFICIDGRSMSLPDHLRVLDRYAHYRPVGEINMEQGIALICAAIAFARQSRIGRLLVDTTGLYGFPPPTTLERFELGKQCAEEAKRCVVVALVAKGEMIDPKRFGVTVARNRDLNADVFTDAIAALAWLLQQNPCEIWTDPARTEAINVGKF